jgi:peptidoglycan lytic transglycosylase D
MIEATTRRLIPLLLLAFCTTARLSAGGLPSLNDHGHPAPSVSKTARPAVLQGHRGPVLHSLDTALFDGIPELQRQLDHYGGGAGHEYLSIVLRRGEPYLSFIHTAAAELGLPWELAYLPIVESSFVSGAVSKSGAAGLWQFMLNSISPYGMRVNQWMDERRDFWKASYGALRKLKDNYEVFGDWLLAVGAYNCGVGCMRRAIEAAGSRDFWTIARGGYLPPETRFYVPRFLAVSHYASYPGRYNLPASWDSVRWRGIILTAPVHLNRLSEAAGIPLDHLISANAELNQPVTPPLSSGYRLKVREEYADSIEEALGRNDLDLVDLEQYTIQSGDTLYALGEYYGVAADLIIEFNPGLNPRRLMIGDKVLIPLMQPMLPYRGPVSGEPPELFAGTVEYTVRAGDTLSAISRRYGTSPESLAFNNDIDINTLLMPGAILQVPASELVRDLPGNETPMEASP